MSKFAWVTLTTNDTYSLGALVLGNSLKRVSTAHQLAVLVTPGVSESMKTRLKDVYNVVQEVNLLDSQDAANLALLARPELGVTFTKLHCWKLIQFEKCVFLDADTLILQNCDELFDREELSAAPDISWPDCFNSGVFVFRPSVDTFTKITQFALEHGSFDGGDQGLLNQYFSDWAQKDPSKRLPFIYNVHAVASYSYLPAFKQFRDRIKILHFTGKFKPWLANFNSETKKAYSPHEFCHAQDLIQLWWDIYCETVHHNLSNEMLAQADEDKKLYEEPFYSLYPQERPQIHSDLPSCSHQSVQDNVYLDYNTYDVIQTVIKPRECYDPWEDYYENLEKFENMNTNYDSNYDYHNENDNTNSSVYANYSDTSNEYRDDGMEELNIQLNTILPEIHEPEEYHEEQEYEGRIENIIHSDPVIEHETIIQNQNERIELRENQNLHNFPVTKEQESRNTDSASEMERGISNIRIDENILKDSNKIPIDSSTLDKDQEKTNATNVVENDEMNKENEAGLAGALSTLRLGEARTLEQDAYEEQIRRQCWEAGNIDYLGKDSFDNIWRKITQTLESGNQQKEAPQKSSTTTTSEKFVSSAEIEDGKVEYDEETGATITYKIIPKGWQQTITTPQPNGTMKTQTKTFYDPVPVTSEELEEANRNKANRKNEKSVITKDGNTTVEIRPIPGGREEITTIVNPDGTKSIKTKTFYDPVEVTESNLVQETTNKNVGQSTQKTVTQQQKQQTQQQIHQQQIEEERIKKQQIEEQQRIKQLQIHQQQIEEERVNKQQIEEQRIKQQQIQKVQQQQIQKKQTETQQQHQQLQLTEEQQYTNVTQQQTVQQTKQQQKIKQTQIHHQSTFEEVTEKRVSQKTETFSGKSITSTSRQDTFEEETIHQQSITEKKDKKTKAINKTQPKALAPPFEDKPGEHTTITEKKISNGTEYHYTTTKEDGTVVTWVKTVYEEEEVEMTEKEIKEYKKQLKEAEKHKNVSKVKQVPSKVGTKQVVPSENPGEVTTVETIKIEGGTEYHYTTVTADGIVKKSSKTVYDPVPVEGNSDEEEVIEEYEEEIIEPGEPVVTTTRTTKPLTDADKKKLAQDVPASKKQEKKSGKK